MDILIGPDVDNRGRVSANGTRARARAPGPSASERRVANVAGRALGWVAAAARAAQQLVAALPCAWHVAI
eukprot:1930313-Pyramimonas_sp.AAC.1